VEDPFNLRRFREAQEPIYLSVVDELRSGRKRTHWMWFIFPQIAGLGRSETARYFALSNLDETSAYLNHSILGARLRECARLVNEVNDRTAKQIFGSPDDLKFCSAMTLFGLVSAADSEFSRAIDKYYSGKRDQITLELAGEA
jgi:uncharacterized protein (DUF1810 family)